MNFAAHTSSLTLLLLAAGCLPVDTRPTPGSINVTVEASAATVDGFTTADGWTVRLDHVVGSMGEVELEAPDDDDEAAGSCVEYTQSRYNRLLDFTTPGPQQLNLAYGLGRCSVRFEYGPPSPDALLGTGITQADLDRLRTPGTDAYTEDQNVALEVRGEATRGEETVRFDWVFRPNIELWDCGFLAGPPTSIVDLQADVPLEMGLAFAAENLFRTAPDDDAPLGFDAFAAADADGDGIVTLDELAEVPPPTEIDLTSIDLGIDVPVALLPTDLTHADFLYLLQFPTLPRQGSGGRCKFELEDLAGFGF